MKRMKVALQRLSEESLPSYEDFQPLETQACLDLKEMMKRMKAALQRLSEESLPSLEDFQHLKLKSK
ncbi:hypothetical protein SUGI_0488570 [Cryptomeria japonica]|nr:hypothetical protein SUGI_0488570 [Cryptomeria japonica]